MEFIPTDPKEKVLEEAILKHPKVVYAFLHVLEVADRSKRVNLLLEVLNEFMKAEKERIGLDQLWRRSKSNEKN